MVTVKSNFLEEQFAVAPEQGLLVTWGTSLTSQTAE
jgi:hypothetical protein